MSKQQHLDKIAQEITEKMTGTDLAKEATRLVMGNGNPNAEIVFIGEAPGKNEDQQGVPFVGAAGKFLDEMLSTIDLTRDDVYVTNIVKYRPPNNRDPSEEEKQTFWPYLERQLAIIGPKLIVTLGRHASNAFLPSFKISHIHGQPKRIRVQSTKHKVQSADEQQTESYKQYDEGAAEAGTQQSAENRVRVFGSAEMQGTVTQVILPLYHPAAALYNGGMRATLLDDFSKIPATLALINQDRSK